MKTTRFSLQAGSAEIVVAIITAVASIVAAFITARYTGKEAGREEIKNWLTKDMEWKTHPDFAPNLGEGAAPDSKVTMHWRHTYTSIEIFGRVVLESSARNATNLPSLSQATAPPQMPSVSFDLPPGIIVDLPAIGDTNVAVGTAIFQTAANRNSLGSVSLSGPHLTKVTFQWLTPGIQTNPLPTSAQAGMQASPALQIVPVLPTPTQLAQTSIWQEWSYADHVYIIFRMNIPARRPEW